MIFDLKKIGRAGRKKTLMGIFLQLGVNQGQTIVSWEAVLSMFMNKDFKKFIHTAGKEESVNNEDLKKLSSRMMTDTFRSDFESQLDSHF